MGEEDATNMLICLPTGEFYSWAHCLKTLLKCLLFHTCCWHSVCLTEKPKPQKHDLEGNSEFNNLVKYKNKTINVIWFESTHKNPPLIKYVLGKSICQKQKIASREKPRGNKEPWKVEILEIIVTTVRNGFLLFFLCWLASSLSQECWNINS